MNFSVSWLAGAKEQYQRIRDDAHNMENSRKTKGITKTSKAEGLFKQVHKTLTLLQSNPRHPGLRTHEYHSLTHPYDEGQKVFEAYVQNRTPGAYRVFWCYGNERNEITFIAITPHP